MRINGKLVVTTEDHPFWSVTDQMWEEVDDLAVGELVQTADGVVVPVTSTVDLDTSRVLPAYNLTVADIHTYFVIAGKAPVLVHNCGDAESLAGSLDEDTFFHYTDDDGMRGIMGEDGGARIGANSAGKVHVTQEMYGPGEAETSLFAGNPSHRGRGGNLIAFKMPQGARLEPGSQPNEVH